MTIIVRTVSAIYCCQTYLMYPFKCQGESMMPTIQPQGDFVIIKSVTLIKSEEIDRGVVAVFSAPDNKSKLVIKRIAGLPGDFILTPSRNIFTPNSMDVVRVRPNHVWILGDNGSNSTDSRYYGDISLNSIIGIAKYKVFYYIALIIHFKDQYSRCIKNGAERSPSC